MPDVNLEKEGRPRTCHPLANSRCVAHLLRGGLDVVPDEQAATDPTTRPPRSGLAAALGAYVLWGAFPAFWPLLAPAGAVEILAHRIAWTLVGMLVVLTAVRGWSQLRG